jgi:hypothetical protein
MSISLKSIDENSFQKSKNKLFSDQKTDRCFAEIRTKNKVYTIAWRSDLIEPDLYEISDSIFAIGVDQKFIIVNSFSDLILFNVDLIYNFHKVKKVGKSLFVATELEVYEIGLQDYSLKTKLDLPDYFEKIEIKNNALFITCIDGEEVQIAML